MAQSEYQKSLTSIKVSKETAELIKIYADMFESKTNVKLSKHQVIELALKDVLKRLQND